MARSRGPRRGRPSMRREGRLRRGPAHRDRRRLTPASLRAVLQGIRAPASRRCGPRRRGSRGARVSRGRPPAPGGTRRPARGRHGAAEQGADRRPRRGDGGGARVNAVGAPIRRQGPGGGGTILDRSVPGRRAWSLPPLDVAEAPVPEEHARQRRPGLPEVGEVDLVRHYTGLAQMNYGLDTGMYPLGSCTMKYNPKVAEAVAALPGFQRLHPLQPDSTAQGVLELLWRLERALCEITGMVQATLQPPAGACGEMTGLLLMRAFHEDRGDARRRVIIPDSAHGTNPASVRLAGFEAVPVRSDARGLVDAGALAKLVDDSVAGLMLTNPNTLGLFEEEIEEIAATIHGVGGLLYYDGANLNAILGRCRPGDMGFDIVHINTHKTFATPHGGGGPGAGPVGVTEELVPYLPAPTVERADDGTFSLERGGERSIGRMHGFHGNVGILVRAYSYVFLHGSDGLKAVSVLAALNANYLAHLVKEDFPLAHP